MNDAHNPDASLAANCYSSVLAVPLARIKITIAQRAEAKVCNQTVKVGGWRTKIQLFGSEHHE